jgi:hypothetical protein
MHGPGLAFHHEWRCHSSKRMVNEREGDNEHLMRPIAREVYIPLGQPMHMPFNKNTWSIILHLSRRIFLNHPPAPRGVHDINFLHTLGALEDHTPDSRCAQFCVFFLYV